MIRLLTAVLLFASFHAVADELKTFSDGQVIEADDFNHNFQKLEQDIADLDQWPLANCSDNDVIKWSADDGRYKCTRPQQAVADCSNLNIPGDPFCIASCPAGSTVISGGCEFEIFDGSSTNPSFTESRPWFNQSTGVMEGWYCGTNGVAYTDKAYAICQ